MENTSYISDISYQIEVWLDEKMTIEEIKILIIDLQKENKFPPNLEFINGYFDEGGGSSGCAFLDKNTGETIVGFAGTNWDGDFHEGLKDGVADLGLAVGGFEEGHPYLDEMDKFMNQLKDEGYNITQTTGHSLGGALAALAAIYYDIPAGITYNGAPTHGYESLEQRINRYINGTSMHKLENYKGKIIRFVSDEDWLNNISNFGHANYVGDAFLINNGKGHDRDFFLDGKMEQKIISNILSSIKVNWNELSDVKFDNGATVGLKESDLIVNNLLGENGQYSGNGVIITIDPEAFSNLSTNLENMILNDIEWLNSTIQACEEKNNALKKSEASEVELSERVADSLNSIGLVDALGKIESSHGVLVESDNTTLLLNITNYNASSVKEKFKGGGWHLDGKSMTEGMYDYIINNIKKFQETSEDLRYEIIRVDEFTSYDRYSGRPQAVYKYETLSVIGEAFVNLTNKLLIETMEVYKGTGLREAKEEGIVDSILEVIEVEKSNIKELSEQIKVTSEIAKGIGINFDEMDRWLSEQIKIDGTQGEYQVQGVPDTYKAYLDRSSIFDDVKDVIEAYDLQVEEASTKLAEKFINEFEELSNQAKTKLNNIYYAINGFRTATIEMYALMSKEVTRVVYEEKEMTGYNEFELKSTTTNHGSLFPESFNVYIRDAKKKILPSVEDLYETIASINSYNSQFCYLKEHLSSSVEKAIYDSQELLTIVEAQNLMRIKLEVMKSEFIKVENEFEAEFKGKSIESYRIQLEAIIRALNYFSLMIGDCFGKNSV